MLRFSQKLNELKLGNGLSKQNSGAKKKVFVGRDTASHVNAVSHLIPRIIGYVRVHDC